MDNTKLLVYIKTITVYKIKELKKGRNIQICRIQLKRKKGLFNFCQLF